MSKSWIKERDEETAKFKAYALALETQNRFLLGEIESISTGFVLPDTPEHWAHNHKLMRRASRALRTCIDSIKVPSKPNIWWC